MTKKNGGVEGNALASELEFQRQMVRGYSQLMRFERSMERYGADGTDIMGMTVRTPTYERPEYLVILKASREGERFVAFASADTFAEAIRTAAAQLENGTVKWKEDRYGNE